MTIKCHPSHIKPDSNVINVGELSVMFPYIDIGSNHKQISIVLSI